MSAHGSELRLLDRRARKVQRKTRPAKTESGPTVEQMADVLYELRDLLQEYAPAWYSPEQHSRVESAIERLSQR